MKAKFACAIAGLVILSACATGGKKPEMSRTERARLLLQIANGAFAEGDTISALQHLHAAEKEDPSIPEIHHTRALAYFVKGEQSLAVESARLAVRLKPDYSDANNTLGKLLMDSGKPQEAIPYLQKAARDTLYRDSYKPYSNLGILHYRRGEFAKAMTYLDKAISQGQGTACVAYYYRGHLHLRASRFGAAISDYDSATRNACGSFREAHFALGIAYEKSGDLVKARRKFVEVQQQFPSSRVAAQAMSRLQALP